MPTPSPVSSCAYEMKARNECKKRQGLEPDMCYRYAPRQIFVSYHHMRGRRRRNVTLPQTRRDGQMRARRVSSSKMFIVNVVLQQRKNIVRFDTTSRGKTKSQQRTSEMSSSISPGRSRVQAGTSFGLDYSYIKSILFVIHGPQRDPGS